MERTYLKKTNAVRYCRKKYGQMSKSTLERYLQRKLNRYGLTKDDSPEKIAEHIHSIKKVFDGRDKRDEYIYHWEWTLSYLDKLVERIRKKALKDVEEYPYRPIQKEVKQESEDSQKIKDEKEDIQKDDKNIVKINIDHFQILRDLAEERKLYIPELLKAFKNFNASFERFLKIQQLREPEETSEQPKEEEPKEEPKNEE